MDASFELIVAVFSRLRSTSAVTAFVGQRIYDRAPADTAGQISVPFPYISNGPSTSVPDDYECSDGEIVSLQLDVWSNGPGEASSTAQCRKICGAIRRALHGAELALSTNALVTLEVEIIRILDDPNPAIKHGAISLIGTVELT